MQRKSKLISRRTIYAILLIATATTILLLTFQGPEGTVKLSETIRLWVEQFGIHSDFHSFRSNAHLIIYFALGVILALLGNEIGLKWWMILIVGCAFGLLDEGIKVLLPTREFDVGDLVKDWVGIVAASVMVALLGKIRHQKEKFGSEML